MSESIAQEALDRILGALFIDEAWSLRSSEHLSWVGHTLRQDFTVSEPWMSHGTELIRIASSIPVLEHVGGHPDDVTAVLAALNRFVGGESLVWDELRREVLCCSGVVAHRDTLEWRVRQLTVFSILGLTMSELLGETLATRLDGSVATWTHPDSGRREEPDEMLGVLHSVVVPQGEHPSKFAREGEFEAVAAQLESTPYFSLGGSPEGICVEVAFGEHDTSLIHARTTEPHPVLGNGLLITTKICPPAVGEGDPVQLAAAMNLAESRGALEANSLGAWCTEGDGDRALLAHSLFVPNVLYQPGVMADFIWNAIRRAEWVAGVLSESGAGVKAYD